MAKEQTPTEFVLAQLRKDRALTRAELVAVAPDGVGPVTIDEALAELWDRGQIERVQPSTVKRRMKKDTTARGALWALSTDLRDLPEEDAQ